MDKNNIREQITQGESFWSSAEYKEALRVFSEINISDAGDGEKAEVLNNIGVIHKYLGNYVEAEKKFTESIVYREKNQKKPFNEYIHTLNNLAVVKRIKGGYKEAERLYLDALKFIEDKNEKASEEYTNLLNNIGVFYMSLGIFDNAEKYLVDSKKRRLRTDGKNSFQYMESLNNFGFLKKELQHLSEAETVYLELIDLMKTKKLDSHANYKKTLKNYCSVLRDSGKNQEALNILEKIIVDFRNEHKHNTYEFIAFLEEYSRALKETELEKHEDIFKLYDEAIEIMKRQNMTKTIQYTNILSEKAELLVKNQKCNEAYLLLNEAVQIQNNIISSISFNLSEEEALQVLKKIEIESSMILDLLVTHFQNDLQKTKETYEKISLRKSAVFEITILQNLITNRLYNTNDSNINKDLSDILQKRAELKSALTQKNGQSDDSEKIEEEIKKIEKEILIQINDLDNEKTLQGIDLKKICRKMKKNELILDFYHEKIKDTYVLFTLNSEEEVKIMEIGSFKEINAYIENYRSLINKSNDPDELYRAAKRLYKKFFRFIQTEKIEMPEKMIISTTGEISKLPFETLINEKDEYLIDKTVVKHISTVKEITERFKKSNSKTIAIITDPDYDYPEKESENNSDDQERGNKSDLLSRSSNEIFDRLHGTKIEGEKIAKLVKGKSWYIKEYLSQKGAVDKKIKKIENSEIIHIATHGFFSSSDFKINPLYKSGLVFTGINTLIKNDQKLSEEQKEEIEDATLSAYDMTNMNLEGTKLLILSACETGLGKYVPGNGIIGLQRAAFMAGVESVIMTLWKIPDKTTVSLMESFYEKYLQNNNPEVALRKAKFELIEELNTQNGYADPYIWGAFIYLDSKI